MSTPSTKDHFKEAEALRERGLYEKAIESYKKTIENDPCFINAHHSLALLYHKTQQFDNAIIHLKKAIELDPNDIFAFNNLGVISYATNRLHEAKAYFEKALFLDSTYKEARYNQVKLQQILKKAPLPFTHKQSAKAGHNTGCLKIGFVSIWFERGQSYVTITLRDVIAKEHGTFVFARTGGVYGRPMLQTDGMWAVQNLTTFHDYTIPHEIFGKWIEENAIDVVIFNEEYDWGIVNFCKNKGVKVITYLDYYKDDWKHSMRLYDAVLCSTQRTFNLVKDICNAYYIGWGIDTELFRPLHNTERKYTYFHNAGWLGINYRKMTPAVILAFDALSRCNPDVTLFIHAQAELERLPPEIIPIVRNNSRITYHVETVPAPGLYYKGSILVFPSKLEGLGLPLLEGMSCGLPAIATDAPPMNEFVQNGYNGFLVKIAQKLTRQDNIAFPEEIVDIQDLTAKMQNLANDKNLQISMADNSRKYAEQHLDLNTLKQKINHVLFKIMQQPSGT
ncbi:MAG: tetratricopeptide repeat protein [Planctomycetia bacterium]|nr:tetratricopeptide repeat protein [Planctomycetia bacterium]